MKNVVLLGATGSIGTSTLEILRLHSDRFRLSAFSANSSIEKAAAIARDFRPDYIVMGDAESTREVAKRCADLKVEVLHGEQEIVRIASDSTADIVVSAIVGAAALRPTLAALEAGKRVALANKEALVMAGELANITASRNNAEILPVDSEHSAVFQCLGSRNASNVRSISLTASGGPFRSLPAERFKYITVKDALNHPTWSMGAKITIDSATMFNKALEVIEAHFLFGLGYDQIHVLVHPQSIVHSVVEFLDGSSIAQMSIPDMRLPIQLALTWPQRIAGLTKPLDLAGIGRLEFQAVDANRFPSVKMGYDAGLSGGTAAAALNAANETAVLRFLNGEIPFTRIFEIVAHVLDKEPRLNALDLENILEVDRWAREEAYRI